MSWRRHNYRSFAKAAPAFVIRDVTFYSTPPQSVIRSLRCLKLLIISSRSPKRVIADTGSDVEQSVQCRLARRYHRYVRNPNSISREEFNFTIERTRGSVL